MFLEPEIQVVCGKYVNFIWAPVLVRVTFAIMNHNDQKQVGEESDFLPNISIQ